MTDDELRDDFGDELADALSVRSRAATDEAEMGVVVHRRAWRVRVGRALTAGLAAAIVVIGASAIVLSQHHTAHISVATAQSSTTTGPVSLIPLTSGVQDWTWVNEDHGWALMRKPCGETVCVGLRETVDGGRKWTTLPAPAALDAEAYADAMFAPVAACEARPCVSSVRFATPEVGWLYGPALFQTLDGGQTWTRIPAERVSDVEAAHGIAMRVTSHGTGCAAGCNYGIDRMDLRTTRWEPLAPPPVSGPPGLLLQGADAYVVNIPHWAGGGQTRLAVSGNAGASWTAIDDPCPGRRTGYRTASASAAPKGVLAVLCLSVTGDKAAVQISTDRGKTFGPRRVVPGTAFGPIAAASAETIAIGYSAANKSGVIVSHDGGRTWRSAFVALAPPSRTEQLSPAVGWQDAHTGRASFNTDAIWTTRDGGGTWTESRATP